MRNTHAINRIGDHHFSLHNTLWRIVTILVFFPIFSSRSLFLSVCFLLFFDSTFGVYNIITSTEAWTFLNDLSAMWNAIQPEHLFTNYTCFCILIPVRLYHKCSNGRTEKNKNNSKRVVVFYATPNIIAIRSTLCKTTKKLLLSCSNAVAVWFWNVCEWYTRHHKYLG